jgi:hypothetical protein
MERKRLLTVLAVVAILIGFFCVGSSTLLAKDDEPGKNQVKIKLPKSLYCAMIPAQDRYSINLRPIANEIGEPAETWEVQLFRNDHLVTSLGHIGGGQKLEEFILFTLPPVDADAFNSTSASSAETNGVDERNAGMDSGGSWGSGNFGSTDRMRGKTGRNFQLRVLNAAGELLAKKKVLLLLN